MNTTEIQAQKRKYNIVGNCDGLNRAIDIILQVASTDLSVLITGESGVGKEALPRMLHDNSLRKTKKYFAVNCGSIPEGTIDSELFGHEKGAFTGAVGEREGYFGVANGGTLFLDEVGELPLATQARLLRVLESGEYIRVGSSEVRKTNVRIVAATNVNIAQAIHEGRFREDLYYRLNTIPISIPPLRQRGNDIVLLFKKFSMDTAEKYNMPLPVRLTDEAAERLKRYSWPGNIRQLKNLTEQISILSTERIITPEILKDYIPDEQSSYGLVPLNPHKETHSFENEREILYKILFDLRSEVQELRKVVMGHATDSRIQDTTESRTQYVAIPASTTDISGANSDDYQTAEEYVEENLRLEDVERKTIRASLEACRGKACRRKAAQQLNISERTLYRKIKEYGLDKEGF